MKNPRVLLSLFAIYLVFAILLNSVGTVILQVINTYGVSKSAASVLEGFKDIPIGIVSFLVASQLPRFGFKNAMLVGLAIVTAASLCMPLVPAFWTAKLLFFSVGVAFALVKVAVYSSIGLLARDRKTHASMVNTLEGVFMVGVLGGYWLFSAFIDSSDPESTAWLNVYWVLAAICALTFVLLWTTALDETGTRIEGESPMREFFAMLRLVARPLVCIYIISAFFYVLIEQGIGTWLPTFNNEILKLPPAMSVQATSIFAAGLAIGRLGAGAMMRRVHWYPVLNGCLVAMAVLILLTLPLAEGIVPKAEINWLNAPVAAFILPLIGLFMAPIYPAINSVMLSSLPKHQHSAMSGLLVIFSALGGTTGSLITGTVFEAFDGRFAFYLSLVPIGVILLSLFFFRRAVERVGRPDYPEAALSSSQ
ncbi:MFS transporter [Microbulbifer thermotolerans]|uniref:MFS transporter n=1 Tax=Microbulbifer thermotolerans TaxID=252514 RepID=A0AB35HZ97_MICTH|nr:MFS transporter [Microbulbifer thermotolerans]MCX2802189.1 MFS transporter [Microbulbifer thermotolerans]MCX2832625.1 MFS transporter [Microbulbifer thermotolerans]